MRLYLIPLTVQSHIRDQILHLRESYTKFDKIKQNLTVTETSQLAPCNRKVVMEVSMMYMDHGPWVRGVQNVL